MAGFDLTPEEEKQLESALSNSYTNFEGRKSQASPALAQNLANFYDRFPYANPDVLVPTVQAFTDGKMSERDAIFFLEDLTKRMANDEVANAPKKKKKKSWWQRNIADKVKTGSRWTMAALNFVPQSVTNLASMGYAAGKQARREGFGSIGEALSTEGFIISTDLGTLLDNDKAAGEGFFVGGKAAEAQSARAREFRGTIGGQAFTMGRGVAKVFYQPGTLEYNRLSGLVDAAAAILVPSVPGGKEVTALAKYGAEVGAAKVGLRSLAGLRDFESAVIIPGKVAEFLNSAAGRSVVERMTKIDSVDEAVEVFPTADVEWLQNVAKISDETAMKQFINDSIGIGDATLGTAPKSVDDWNISRWDTIKTKGIKQRESVAARYMASMPGQHVVLSGGSAREKLQAVKNVKNYLRLLKIDPQIRKNLVGQFADAIAADDGSMRNVLGAMDSVIRTSLSSMGASDELITQMMKGMSDFKTAYEKALYGAVGDSGDAADFGGIFDVIVDGQIQSGFQPLNTAGLQSEMLRHSMMLPDPRQTRRIMSKLGWVTGKEGFVNPLVKGQLRMPLSALEWMQNEIWRPFTLITGGYVLRNMTDSLLRQSFNPNTRTGIFHPLELIMVSTFKRFKGDILGDTFKGDYETLIRNGQREMAEASNGVLRETRDATSRTAREMVTGVWKRVRRSDGKNEYMKGVAAELALLASDDVAKMVAEGRTVDEIIQVLTSDPKKDYVTKLQNRWKNKTITMQDGTRTVGTVQFIDGGGDLNVKNLETYIQNYVIPRVESVTGGSNTLKQIVSNGTVTDIAGDQIDVLKFDPVTGRVTGYNEDSLFPTLSEIVDDPNVVLKETYKVQETISTFDSARRGNMGRMIDAYDRVVDKFFAELYPKREAFLNRSPVFRQFYYDTVGKLIDDMTQTEASRIWDNIVDAAQREGKTFADDRTARIWAGKYVGDPELADKLFDIKQGVRTTTGTLSVEQVDAYAKGFALDETKRLFYNAAEKSNFADVMRIIAPFGSAWAEVTKKWAGMLSSDPEMLKRFGVTVRGLQNADPDNDGKGFFYRDPQTGEYVFNYPFSDQLAPFVMALGGTVTGAIAGGLPGAAVGGIGLGVAGKTLVQPQLEGLNTTFAAPVKSLSMGMSLLPGVGPYVQIAAGKILGDKPETEFFAQLISPYGQPNFSPMPSWAKKVASAIAANPENDRLFGDLKIDVMKALSTTGEFDLTSEQGKLDLEKEATKKARILLFLQGLGQFTGPTRPTPEFKVATAQGDMMANELSKAWYEMRQANFDTAVETFLETFGDEAFMYMQGKTVSSVGGLDTSKEFQKWERDNGDIFSKYPEVAGYFAPTGTETDWRIYIKQLESGKRKRLSAKELIDQAQALVGKAMYRTVVRRVGPNPTKQQQEMLSAYKKDLGDKFPGYANAVMDVNFLKRRIDKLYEAVDDPQLQNNPVTDALKTYFRYRDEALFALAQMGGKDLSNKKAAELRSILRGVGEDLAINVPQFERIWNYVLFDEVDLIS